MKMTDGCTPLLTPYAIFMVIFHVSLPIEGLLSLKD